VLVILNLGFRECSLIVNAPVNWSRAFVDIPTFDEATKHTRRFGFIVIGHRQVGIFPRAEDAESFEVARLIF